MELRHLKYFALVAEEENVSRAAARLHVSQPGLSRQIRDLEEQLGVALFYHSAKSLKLTEAGRVFQKEVRAVLLRLEQATQTVKAFSDGNLGELHIGYAPSLSTKILPRTLRSFQAKCGRVRVQLHDLSTEAMLAGLRDESLQAAFLVKPSAPALRGLAFHEIFRFRACVALPLSHPLAGKKPIHPQELSGETFVAYTRSEYPEHHAWMTRIFRKVRPAPRFAAEYDSSTSLIAAVESGAGVALVQEGFESLAGNRLALRLLTSPATSFSFGIAHRKEDVSASTGHFIQCAREE